VAAVHHVGAGAPGLVTPKNDKARWQAGSIGWFATGIESPNCQAERLSSQEFTDDFSALQARFEEAGLGLYELSDGAYLATGSGSPRRLYGIGSARALLAISAGLVRAEHIRVGRTQ
jgi:hypothetical protein